MSIKKAVLYGVIGYVGVKTLKVYTKVTYNVGKISGYLDIINSAIKKEKEEQEVCEAEGE